MIVLVIVDMQIGYKAAQDADLIERITEFAQSVHNEGGYVVELAMDNGGRSSFALPFEIHTVMKDCAEGGTILYAYLLGAGLAHGENHFVLAGVNMSQCVFRTATSLAERLANEKAMCDHVTIRTDLCGDGERFRVRFEQGPIHEEREWAPAKVSFNLTEIAPE